MANVMFKKGFRANLPAAITEGTFYVAEDECALYLDVSSENRIRFGDFQIFETVDKLNALENPSETALCYVKDINCLARWDGTQFSQINTDTGVTSVEVVGDGNVVTAASYNPVNRKLTLTMGKTMAERSYVGEIPDGYTEETIVAYINKKAEETLNAASGGSSESAASVLAALNTYKAETDPRLEALETDTHTHDNKAELDKIAEGDKAKWDASEQNAKDYADGLAKNYDAAGSAAAVQTKLEEEIARADAAEKVNAAAAKVADDKAVVAQADVNALKLKVGEVADGKTVVEMIADAKTAATYDDTALKGRVEANEGAIAKLNGAADADGSVDYKIAQAVAKIMENPDDTMNSINELVTWCNAHATEALTLTNSVEQNAKDIDALEALVGSTAVATQIADAIAAALKIEGVDKYALAADLTAAIARIAALESKSHEHTNKAELDLVKAGDVAKWNTAQANAEKTAADALAAAKSELEGKITSAKEAAEGHANDLNTAMDTRVKSLEAIDHEAYKAYADQAETDAKAYADSLAANYDVAGAAAAALSDAKTYADVTVANAKLVWGSF